MSSGWIDLVFSDRSLLCCQSTMGGTHAQAPMLSGGTFPNALDIGTRPPTVPWRASAIVPKVI